ncbi:phage/plasmid primase, P4 family, C-terminal domain protein [Collimonas fungivorans]|uniref:Phage/plasmid primase, P4 family, C-terminal domain protein n=1 Tax=Collimonas fungivorans TaxID=158899 RepID=A0A127P849_9BURK|nr:phage/plasmid primase, P4 family [Collimonas fungivorans]AMO93999.1 phage/plasmid primase, P4 family, C-terminal domain protein [Collimonas fungivorans]
MSKKSKLIPITNEMRQFKKFIHPNVKACFQTFSKKSDLKKKSDYFVASWKSETRDKLVTANLDQMEVSMMINRGDGRGSKNVTDITAVFIDCDDNKMTKEKLFTLPIPPQLIVETSPGNFHAYWLIKDCSVSQFKPMQKALAASLGADLNVCDPSRVMRMPGTISWKRDKPFLAQIIHIEKDSKPIAVGSFVKKMKLEIQVPNTLSKKTNEDGDGASTYVISPKKMTSDMRAKVKAAITGINADNRWLWFRFGMAIHSADCTNRGYDLWTEWSQKSTKFDEVDQRKNWGAFKADGALNIKSLFWLANREKSDKNLALDEMSVADMFADSVKHRLRYDRDNKAWLYFSGVVWVNDAQAPLRIARDFIEDLSQGEVSNDSVKRFRSNGGLKGIVAQAELLDDFHISAEAFDKAPNLFAVKNGVIDLITGKCRKAKANDYLRRQANVEFDPDAKCPHWIEFLRSVLLGDKKLHRYLRRTMGYTMFGHANLQIFFMIIGSGGNGKGVLMRTMQTMMGEYGQSVAPNLLTSAYSGNANGPSPALARLYGARMVVCTELPTGRKLDDAFIKQYAGGDEITARQTYGGIFSFKPEGKLWISTNEVPEISASDEAMWRRIKPIPFNRKIRGKDVDENLEKKFAEEYPGILNWMLNGATDFSENGLGECAAIKELENKLRKDADSALAWRSEFCIEEEGAHTQASVAYDSYTNYMRTLRRKPLSVAAFRASLVEKGFHHKKGSQHNYFEGFRLQA